LYASRQPEAAALRAAAPATVASVSPTPRGVPVPREQVASGVAAEQRYVGSKNSNKYHLPWCSGARRIAEHNKVWFSSKAEAEAAGYTPAGNCKGI